jgi:hypothetical protein
MLPFDIVISIVVLAVLILAMDEVKRRETKKGDK